MTWCPLYRMIVFHNTNDIFRGELDSLNKHHGIHRVFCLWCHIYAINSAVTYDTTTIYERHYDDVEPWCCRGTIQPIKWSILMSIAWVLLHLVWSYLSLNAKRDVSRSTCHIWWDLGGILSPSQQANDIIIMDRKHVGSKRSVACSGLIISEFVLSVKCHPAAWITVSPYVMNLSALATKTGPFPLQ